MKQKSITLDCSDAGVMDLIFDPDALKIWEYIRASRNAVRLQQLEETLELDLKVIRQAVDTLVKHQLLMKVHTSRTKISYQATGEQIIIAYDEHDTEVTDRLLEHSKMIHSKHRDIVCEHEDPEFHSSAGMRFRHSSLHHFTKNELAELRRRVHAVISFLNMPRNQQPSDEDARFCNQGVSISLDPLVGKLLPSPTVVTTPRSTVSWWDATRAEAAGLDTLTPREREISLAVGDGLTRAQIADQLSISVNTVSTLLRRAYKKLGVTSQTELAARLAGHDRPLPGNLDK